MHYNNEFNAKYTLAECLDVFDSTRPQPEIKLKEQGKRDIVIEHKIITWPLNYLQKHQAEHDFMDFFTKTVKEQFQDDLYLLEINTRNIQINKKKNKKIADIVLRNKKKIKTFGLCNSLQPFKWSFHRVADFERDESTPNRGVGVNIHLNTFSFLNNGDWNKHELEEVKMKNGIKKILISHLNKTVTKFDNYFDCIRIFITELYGENDLLDHNIIEDILPSIEVPPCIDQIWVGYPEWMSESEQETFYKLIKV